MTMLHGLLGYKDGLYPKAGKGLEHVMVLCRFKPFGSIVSMRQLFSWGHAFAV